MGSVEIVEYDPGWPAAFRDVGARLRSALGERATRIDHIGSTAVPCLAAKDIIDVKVSVETVEDLEPTGLALAGAGWILSDVIAGDHDVARRGAGADAVGSVCLVSSGRSPPRFSAARRGLCRRGH